MIDSEGFRIGVGMIISNHRGELLWLRRIGRHAWQFPQGGLLDNEEPEAAVYRELYEEIGLRASDIKLLGHTKEWLSYSLPERLRRNYMKPLCIGQKQKWFLLYLTNQEAEFRFDCTDSPEFDRWRWVHYWYPIRQVISFKRHVYRRALEELVHFLPESAQWRKDPSLWSQHVPPD